MLIYPVIATLRKLCLVVTIVFMQSYTTFSVFFVNFQAQIMVMVLGLASPFSNKLENNMLIVNELFMLISNYHLFMFTDFLPSPDSRQKVGLSLSVTLCACVFLNLGVISLNNIFLAMRSLKLRYLQLKQRKALRKHNERINWFP